MSSTTPHEAERSRSPLLSVSSLPTETPTSTTTTTTAKTAVTRRWSDLSPSTFIAATGGASFTYSVLAHPLYLGVARQQCTRTPQSLPFTLRNVVARDGLGGLFRGCTVSTVGTVATEVLYNVMVEMGREMLGPDGIHKDFAAGASADALATPLYTPFALLSQKQMTVGCDVGEATFQKAWPLARKVWREGGVAALFRGVGCTMAAVPLGGMWWSVFFATKRTAYDVIAPGMSRRLPPTAPRSWRSTTDNPLLNATCGAIASAVHSGLSNPLMVLRVRLQVAATPKNVGFGGRLAWVVADAVRREGLGVFYRGLGGNVFLSMGGGAVFAATYEASKAIADVSA